MFSSIFLFSLLLRELSRPVEAGLYFFTHSVRELSPSLQEDSATFRLFPSFFCAGSDRVDSLFLTPSRDAAHLGLLSFRPPRIFPPFNFFPFMCVKFVLCGFSGRYNPPPHLTPLPFRIRCRTLRPSARECFYEMCPFAPGTMAAFSSTLIDSRGISRAFFHEYYQVPLPAG